MFEKEAKEYEKRKHYLYEDNDYCGDIADGIMQAYQQGAEFGYNKCDKIIRKENAELKEQIEKMKNCQNCRWWDWNTCKHKDGFCKSRLNWESKRNT